MACWADLVNCPIIIYEGELCELAGISGTSIAKLGRGDSVTTDMPVKICTVLKCDFADIMEMEPLESDEQKEHRKETAEMAEHIYVPVDNDHV
jgi:DNA-binding Xre family transcriptional regulator